jgi:hypothetical protein
MNSKLWRVVVIGLCVLTMSAVWAAPASAQMSEVKEKPPMYTYVADWAIPRANWGEMVKANAADQQMLEKATANGTLVGYGSDTNMVHRVDGMTHDDWWSSMSMAGVLGVLDQAYKSGNATSPVYISATKHSDSIFVSRFYNWHSGSIKGGYTHGSSYTLKADAPPDAMEMLTKNLIAPLLEKMLADGTIVEYEVDTQAIHTDSPSTFWLFYITPTADGLDKVSAALEDTLKANPLASPAFRSMVDYSTHRDDLAQTDATYK